MAVSPLVIRLHCSHAFCVQSGAPKNSGRSLAPQSWDRLMFGNDDKFPARFCSFSGLNHFCRYSRFKPYAMNTMERNSSASGEAEKFANGPDHLLVLVHGILASPSDWTYVEAELRRQLGGSFLIYASSANTYTKTLGGVDVAGRRLADEVKQVVHNVESLTRISFLAHSLGGLFARHAISVLYSQDHDLNNARRGNKENPLSPKPSIAGLEPVNFITLATPHLGVRGKNQLPMLLGVPLLEKLAPPIATILVRRTGRQLFLTDGRASKPPLLLRMASDCEDGKFISALAAFKFRIVYANVSYDHMVGWRTSSIRREIELVKPPRRSLDGYKHVVDVEYCPPVPSDGPTFPPQAAKSKETAQRISSSEEVGEYHDILEEEMIRELQWVGSKKMEVGIHPTSWLFLFFPCNPSRTLLFSPS
ncbi:uncharacterized protein LOC116267174 isoform X2 [Nymphaea colorata]|uniref:uncharacterized protein LOC116267174 isoform X2 n=1 Tax=Nymphaea colorata TaxID=210225 RepID=UPI00214E1FA7|nr:uncharacterized protein LOC116267174 isoform X2 [Nymphaea colorata]